jgi:hypothetical protein
MVAKREIPSPCQESNPGCPAHNPVAMILCRRGRKEEEGITLDSYISITRSLTTVMTTPVAPNLTVQPLNFQISCHQ